LSSKQSRNLIQWVPGESYWQPQNIAKTRRNTLTFTIGGRLIKIINFTTNFTINESISINEKKPMLYAPKYIGSISLETNLHHINGWINGQYMGERITMYSWPMDVKMNPYMVLTCGINYTINPNITVLFSINNLLNNNYMTVNGYPEPGRSFSLSIQYKPKNKKKKS
jgi:outer membrane cobalamin receptor